ncbi:FecCD family ABC transporter permease [Butyrivibrio sp. FCS014]|uniref:FecCD family ABC transporter permease n=1 Tax=Butyrivibrio sp. FCS014 TaxID=1408304 RepID=UPI000463E65F|nr:iron ABC transporter permease [Butyrivibrio sp. FCS014]
MKRHCILYAILIILVLLLMVLCICVGSVDISPFEILHLFASGDHSTTAGKILFDIRLPRTVEALFLGGALALSGYLLQTFFSNPIAGPYILGISSGAKLVVALLMVASLKAGFVMNSWMLIVSAFAGSLIATGFVLAVSTRVRSMSVLVVCGVMVGYICSAVTELLVTFADDVNIVNLHNWALGTFSSAAWRDAFYYIPISMAGLIAAFMISKTMEAYMYGENYATTLGINVRAFRTVLIILSSILSATVTAFAGPVSFVGIAMPHVARLLFKSGRPKVIIPASFLMGSAFCLFSDLIARSLFSPTELSISTVTAIFGAPVVVSMMIGRRKQYG